MRLREVLHAHIPTLRPTSTFRDAVDKMDVYQFPALVIVDEDAVPIAVVTEGDLCRAALSHGGVMRLTSEPVIQFATPDPEIATLETEVSDALLRMLSSGLTILPVVDAGRLAGVVLRVDLMQAMLLDTLVEP